MSYEGYTEWRCKCGAVEGADVYSKQPIACATCGERFISRRSVDSTNGHHVGRWRNIEYRPRFKDYVAKGYAAAVASEKGAS